MTYPQIFLILLESRLLREKEGSSLLVHAPITLLFPHFSIFLHFLSYSNVPSFLPYFPFLFFFCYFSHLFSLLFQIAFCVVHFSLCTAKAFLYCLSLWVLLFYPSTTFGLVWVSFPNYPLVCRLPSHHYYPVLAVPRSIPKQKSFVLFSYSPWHSYPDKGWVFSLTNSYDMYLVILAHLFLFWVVCHFSRIFPPKELKREPQNKFSPSSYR